MLAALPSNDIVFAEAIKRAGGIIVGQGRRRRPRATTPKQRSTPDSLFAARTRDRFW